jgi:hypothetical protein
MNTLLKIISLIGLLLTIIPPILFFTGSIEHAEQNLSMFIGTLLWFGSAWFWLGRKAKG